MYHPIIHLRCYFTSLLKNSVSKSTCFVAQHIYVLQLNSHPRIHLFVTRRGYIWQYIFFKKIVEYHWRQAIITLLWKNYVAFYLLATRNPHIRDYYE